MLTVEVYLKNKLYNPGPVGWRVGVHGPHKQGQLGLHTTQKHGQEDLQMRDMLQVWQTGKLGRKWIRDRVRDEIIEMLWVSLSLLPVLLFRYKDASLKVVKQNGRCTEICDVRTDLSSICYLPNMMQSFLVTFPCLRLTLPSWTELTINLAI